MDVDALWALPGPRRFLDRILEAIDRRSSLVVYTPVVRGPSDLAEAVKARKSLRRGLERVELTELVDGLGTATIADRLAAAVGIELEGDGQPSSLAAHPELQGVNFWVDGRGSVEEEGIRAWQSFLKAFAKGVGSLESTDRTVIVSVLAGMVQPVDSPLSDASLYELGWIGVVDPLDTAIVVRDALLASQRIIDPTVERSIIEIARFDLELAERLALEWDGDLASLMEKLPDLGERSMRSRSPTDGPRVAALTPDEIAAWSAGLLESWQGRLAMHVGCHGASAREHCDQQIWRAQVGILLGEIQEWCVRLARWASQIDGVRQLYCAEKLMGMEVAELSSAVGPRVHLRYEQVRRLLQWLKDARNDLAHVRPLTLDRLRAGRDLMASVDELLA